MFSAPTRLPRLKAGVADLPRKRGRYGACGDAKELHAIAGLFQGRVVA
jgi:hypothetical protein